MGNLIHISASPRGDRSQSQAIASAFLNNYQVANPSHLVDTIDLWNHQLPPLDNAALEAKYSALRKLPHTEQQASAWSAIEQEANRLFAYDKILFSVPMWNWNIPFVLKHFIDVVTQPGILFDWTPATGYIGRLKKPVAVIYSSSFDYTAGGPMQDFDFQKNYFEHWLKIVGCNDISTIIVAPTAGPESAVAAAREEAIRQAGAIARDF
jgi:FMN-dependent NADH-azoreductase